ncbi:hypothetical protein ZIOFF_066611 [Zingiber officinale]|uniref:Citrate transporter-like domain-containing protein n=1 Tax=Zingiber officinale TaxID=94328 RepID=A0A8J5F392_ZINOF|nr:hypothetical protein ZIOFF_066611 [Zingiber officinale]
MLYQSRATFSFPFYVAFIILRLEGKCFSKHGDSSLDFTASRNPSFNRTFWGRKLVGYDREILKPSSFCLFSLMFCFKKVYALAISFFELFLLMSWSAIAAALALIVLDFQDARPSLEKVSYSLLLFFCGMFITVDGFNKTGLPSALWDYMEPYARIDTASGALVLTVVILFLSNVASNVPTVLLLGARVAASAAEISPGEETKAWLMLAWVSTVAGNLSLLGSAANLIIHSGRRFVPVSSQQSFLSVSRTEFSCKY